jgi:toxin ParE1/3/4
MEIIFTEEAKQDLDQLRDWLEPLSPNGLANVGAALEARIRALAANPAIGRPTARDDVREAVEAKYGFLIPYYVRGEKLHVLRVYRPARKPLDYEELSTEENS